MIDTFTYAHAIIIEEEMDYYHEIEFIKRHQDKFNSWLDSRLKDRAEKIKKEADQC